MNAYAKSIAAAIGLIAIFSKEAFGFEIPNETVDGVVNGVMMLLTWIAIYAVPNTPAPTPAA